MVSNTVGAGTTPPAAEAFDPVAARKTGGLWRLVWSDEFDTATVDALKWNYETNCAGGGNNELQCYTDAAQNAYIANGQLHIDAIAEQATGFDGWNGLSGNVVTRDYSSARLTTQNKGDWRYARVEVSAKVPFGQGIWPAVWMMPTDSHYGQWPLSGEIDIMEAINLDTGGAADNQVHQTLHFGNPWPNNQSVGHDLDPGFDVTADFNNYAVEWQEGEIRWYINDVLVANQNMDDWFTVGAASSAVSTTDARPFDQRFFLILNLAVGGNWPGAPDASTLFPNTFSIDYVRVYQCADNEDDGIGCATLDGSPDYE